MKKKINKKLLARIGAILACVLLVGALVVPCFADETETQAESTLDREAVLAAFCELYHLDSTSPLYEALFDMLAVTFEEAPMLYQFRLALEQDVLNPQTQFLTYGYTAPFDYYDDVIVCNTFDNSMYDLGNGHWSTSYTTSGDNRFLYLKYFTLRDDQESAQSIETLRIRFRIDKNTLQITEVTVELKDLYNLTLASDNVVIASVGSRMSVAPIDYCISNGFLRSEVSVGYDTFESILDKGYSGGYQNGFNAGHEQGIQEGYNSGYNNGFEVGRADGYHSGYIQGSSDAYYDGYDDGYYEGFSEGEESGYQMGRKEGYDNGYEEGYGAGINTQQSAILGKNLLGDIFSTPIEALNNFTLIDWELSSGKQVTITLGAILGAALAVVFVMWFLKLFAGG